MTPKCDLNHRMGLAEMIDGRGWTEERHAAFLKCIEESFIHRMFNTESCDTACSSGATSSRIFPLDRAIPDSATESTLDSWSRKTGNELKTVKITNRMRKRQLSQLDTSQDQVVPQLDNSKKKRRV